MYLKYGTYSHTANECSVTIERTATRVQSGVARETLERWNIMGLATASSQSALTTKLRAIEAAYSENGKDIGLYDDSGTATVHLLRDRDTIDGVFVVKPPSYPEGSGAEYSLFRTFSIAVEGKTTSETSNLLAYAQSITYQGNGGPAWDYLVPLNGAPQAQMFTQRSLVTVTQEGQAVGYSAYPTPPQPIWSQYLLNDQCTIRHELPSIDSKERRVSWQYVFRMPTRPI